MHDNQDLTLARATRVLAERLRPAIHSSPHPLSLEAYRVGGEPVPVADGLAADYSPCPVGSPWGRAWDTTWFRVTGEVPAEFAGLRVEVLLDLGFDINMTGFQAEGLAYRADGSPVRSLHPRAQWIPVVREAAGGEPIEFYVEAASNPVLLDYVPFQPTESGEWETAGEELLYRIRRADVVVFETEVFELVHDVEVLLQLAEQLDATSARRAKILFALDRALDAVDLQDVAGTAAAGRVPLAELLASPAAPSAHRITAVGHAHIDSAWLWPLRETVRKVARTTSSMTTLLDEHDDFVYAMSSAQQYAWIKEHRPEVYARVKQAVADGRFVPVGGMWVEADAVLPGGEAMIRQFLYGQRFFRDEFGIECRGAWLPDSFGYSGALPQLLVGSGFDWFLTQKISWNERNVFPHSSFEWEGIDGSSCGRALRPSGPGPPTRTTCWTRPGARCCCSSSTTSCPAPRSPGCTARPPHGTPG
jgi:alpha-mannosidase